MSKSKAFTLAEVLITLVIIGVIAAMTIPTLMGSTNKQEIKTAYKKAMSALNQAASLEYALYGHECFKDFDCQDHNLFASMMKNHMSVIDSCIDGDCSRWKTADGLIYDVVNCCEIQIDLNGDKGNGTWGEDVLTAVIFGSAENHRTFTPVPKEWDNGFSEDMLYN